ncbi:MAG: DUF6382 domain-containing protein [bacterium]|nr:DUF6382 domain-containing protein [bacterium]
MVEHEVKRGGSKTVVSITIKESSQFNEFQYRMLKENQVEGILKVERSIQNETVVYDYDISGMQSFEERNQGKKLNIMEIKELYTKVLSTLLLAEEYFLEKDSFIIGQEFIYFLAASRAYGVIYCPEYKREIKEQFADLTEYIINHIGYEEQSGVAMVYELFKMFRDGHSTLKDILTYLNEGQRRPEMPNQMQSQVSSNPMCNQGGGSVGYQNPIASQMNNPVQPAKIQQQNSYKPMSSKEQAPERQQENGFSSKKLLLYCGSICVGLGIFLALYLSGMLFVGHTKKLDTSKLFGIVLLLGTVVGYACYRINQMKVEEKPKQKKEKKTSKPQQMSIQSVNVISQQMPAQEPVNMMPQQMPVQQQQKSYAGTNHKQYCLVDAGPSHGQQYMLYKTPYLVGKSSEQVDGVIYSEAVSRVHAEFIIENNQLYVMDMSSTNGTYVNRRKIGSNQRIPVNPGDEIRIADKQFQLIS